MSAMHQLKLSPCRATIESAKALAVLVDGHEANRAQALRAGAAGLLLRMVAAVARTPSQAQQPTLFEAACEWSGGCLARYGATVLTSAPVWLRPCSSSGLLACPQMLPPGTLLLPACRPWWAD